LRQVAVDSKAAIADRGNTGVAGSGAVVGGTTRRYSALRKRIK
jgi:hypothetical protein